MRTDRCGECGELRPFHSSNHQVRLLCDKIGFVTFDFPNLNQVKKFVLVLCSEICEELDEKIETSDGDEGTKRRMKGERNSAVVQIQLCVQQR